MGSSGPTVPEEEFTVLVTGFGPFKKEYPVNPSWEMASRLPDYLPPLHAKTSMTTAARVPDDMPPVRIVVHPEPVRVNYQVARALVPTLWSGWPDVVVHVGMAGPRLSYAIERLGHRDGYALKDVDGELLGDEERRECEGPDWVWASCPSELTTDVDVEDVLGRWRRYSPEKSDLSISDNAGRFLCEFIYYSSLAHLYKAGERRRVVFLHVPCVGSEAVLAAGKEVLLQLVRSVAESEVARRRNVPEPES